MIVELYDSEQASMQTRLCTLNVDAITNRGHDYVIGTILQFLRRCTCPVWVDIQVNPRGEPFVVKIPNTQAISYENVVDMMIYANCFGKINHYGDCCLRLH